MPKAKVVATKKRKQESSDEENSASDSASESSGPEDVCFKDIYFLLGFFQANSFLIHHREISHQERKGLVHLKSLLLLLLQPKRLQPLLPKLEMRSHGPWIQNAL